MSIRRASSSNPQPSDSDLTAIAALSTTAFGRSLLSGLDAAAIRTLIGTVIGTNVQAWNATLDSLAGQSVQTYGKGLLGKASKEEVQTTLQQPGIMLALLLNVAGSNQSTTSATQADLDATNDKVTFTTPASGQVLVRCTFRGTMSGVVENGLVGLREDTTNVKTGQFAMQGILAAARDDLCTVSFYVSGLSPGSVHTYKLAFSVTGGATFTIQQGATSPVTMEVWANAVPVPPVADGIDRAAGIVPTSDRSYNNIFRATDGDDGTSASANDNTTPRSFQVDLGVGAGRYMYSARLVWSDSGHSSKNGSIQASDDGSTWVDIATWSNVSTTTRTFNLAYSARYWRIRTTALQGGGGEDINTFSLFS